MFIIGFEENRRRWIGPYTPEQAGRIMDWLGKYAARFGPYTLTETMPTAFSRAKVGLRHYARMLEVNP
jgi:hypothetical protein